MKNSDMPAMPSEVHTKAERGYPSQKFMSSGLTKREMFAMAAMQGLLSNSAGKYTYNEMTERAVNCADALLEKLGQAK